MDNILTSIKKLLGIEGIYEHFDDDIIMHINSVFMILNQLGIGPKEGFNITKETKWNEYTTDKNLEAIRTYIYLKVRLVFDPPSSSFAIESIQRTISEYEWRFSIHEGGGTDGK